MAGNIDLEYVCLYYAPHALSEDKVCIAAAVFDSSMESFSNLFVANEWEAKVQGIDPEADLVMLRALLTEVGSRLRSRSTSDRHEIVRELEDSFSNTVQVSVRACVKLSGESVEGFAGSLVNRSH